MREEKWLKYFIHVGVGGVSDCAAQSYPEVSKLHHEHAFDIQDKTMAAARACVSISLPNKISVEK